MDKVLIKNLKEFKKFYEDALVQCKKDNKPLSYIKEINKKIKEIEQLIAKYS